MGKAVGVLLLFMFTRAAAAVRCAENEVDDCFLCVYRPTAQGIDAHHREPDNCRNSPDCMLGSDNNCRSPPPPSSAYPSTTAATTAATTASTTAATAPFFV